jgi:hypothetical protein
MGCSHARNEVLEPEERDHLLPPGPGRISGPGRARLVEADQEGMGPLARDRAGEGQVGEGAKQVPADELVRLAVEQRRFERGRITAERADDDAGKGGADGIADEFADCLGRPPR